MLEPFGVFIVIEKPAMARLADIAEARRTAPWRSMRKQIPER